jgi:hypothetical protein
LVENRIVSEVAEARVIVPTAPLLNVTVLSANVELNPNPLMMILDAVMDRLFVLTVTTGITFATCTGVPLDAPLVVTTAVKLPSVVGRVVRLTVSAVAVAVVTVPMAPLLNVTVLFAAVVLKPKPLIVKVEVLAPILAELSVTIGARVATRTGVPLDMPLIVTTAVKMPAEGRVDRSTVREVDVDAMTVPAAPLLRETMLFAAVVSKPAPLIVIVFGFRARTALLSVTVGVTPAILTGSPLPTELLVTTAVKSPTVVGFVPKVTVSAVAVAEVTVPTAPLFSTTELFARVVLKPNPRMTIVFAASDRVDVLDKTTGFTVAT